MANLSTYRLRDVISATPPREVVFLDREDDRIPFDRLTCPKLRFIAEGWFGLEREEGEKLPLWSAFRPRDFVTVIDLFCVLKLGDWRNDEIEFSLFGGHPTDYIGSGRPMSMQQLRHDPLRSPNYYDIRDRAGRAVENEAPQYVRKTLSWNDKNFIEYETLLLPFRRENGVQRVLQPVSAAAKDRDVATASRKFAVV